MITTASIISGIPVFVLGTLVFIFVPGLILVDVLRVGGKTPFERVALSSILGVLAVYFLAHAVFLLKSDLPWYFYSSICVAYVIYSFYRLITYSGWWKRMIGILEEIKQGSCFYWGIYGAMVLAAFAGYFALPPRGFYLRDSNSGIIGIISDWDHLFMLSMINETRNFFIPLGNEFLPGEPPVLYSWLSVMLPTFFVKYLGMDQAHSYYIWGPLVLYVFVIWAVHYFASLFSKDKWVPLFAVGFLICSPIRGLDQISIKSLGGILLIFSTLIFMAKYFIERKRVYIVLSFGWFFLYMTKGNYVLATFLGLILFYWEALFQDKRSGVDFKNLRVLVFCLWFPALLFWISRTQFALRYTSYQNELVWNWQMVLGDLAGNLLIASPVIMVFWFYCRHRSLAQIPPMGKVVIMLFVNLMVFCAFAKRLLESDSQQLVYLLLLISFLLIIETMIRNKTLFHGIGVACMALLVLVNLSRAEPIEGPGYVPLTADEVRVFDYIRDETPADSVILHNVFRYIDRPSIFNALTYRKSFIMDAERFDVVYPEVLETRIYDYLDFLLCHCSLEERKQFFNKYPAVNYYVDYGDNFEKSLVPLVGGGKGDAVPAAQYEIYPSLYEKVFVSGEITVYKIKKI